MSSSDLKKMFEQASEEVQKLPNRPDNETLLKLYSYFKQGSVGDVAGKRPGLTSFKDRAKFDAWSKLKGVAKETAMQEYINLVKGLKE